MRQECHLARYMSTNKCAVLSDVPFIFLSSVVVLSPNGNFFVLCHSCIQWATHTHNLPPFLVPPSYCECNLLSISIGVNLTMLLRYTRNTNVGNAVIRLCLDLWRKWAWKKCHRKNEECLKQSDTLSRAVTIRVLPGGSNMNCMRRGPVRPIAFRSPRPGHCHQQQFRTPAGCAERY
jgi:hypothetical protein